MIKNGKDHTYVVEFGRLL